MILLFSNTFVVKASKGINNFTHVRFMIIRAVEISQTGFFLTSLPVLAFYVIFQILVDSLHIWNPAFFIKGGG